MLKTVLGFPRIYTYRETSDFSTRANGPVGGPGMWLKPPCTQSRMVSAAFSGLSRSTSRCAQARRRYGPARAHYQASDDTATAFIRCKNGQAGVAVSCGVLRRRVELREPRHRYPWVAAFQPAGREVRAPRQRATRGRTCRSTTHRRSFATNGARSSTLSPSTSSHRQTARGGAISWRYCSRRRIGHHWARGRTRIRAPVAEPDQRLADHDRTWLALAARSRVTR